jgi:hypothetical protein
MNTGSTNDTHAPGTSRSARGAGSSAAARATSRRSAAKRGAQTARHGDAVSARVGLDRPVGRVSIAASSIAEGRIFTCDPVNHRIDVSDASLRPLFSFGGFGSEPGQFNQPTDVALVPLGPPDARSGAAALALVVADRDNHRIQIFELDGALIACIDPWRGRSRHVELLPRGGWPYFRINPIPQLVLPARLEWRQGFLEVMSAEGHIVQLDLALTLLPDFDTWLGSATRSVARQALEHFRRRPAGHSIPESYLHAIRDKVRAGFTLVAGGADGARRPSAD